MARRKQNYRKHKTPNPNPKSGVHDRRLSHLRRANQPSEPLNTDNDATENLEGLISPDRPIIDAANSVCEESPVIKYIAWPGNTEDNAKSPIDFTNTNLIVRSVSNLRKYTQPTTCQKTISFDAAPVDPSLDNQSTQLPLDNKTDTAHQSSEFSTSKSVYSTPQHDREQCDPPEKKMEEQTPTPIRKLVQSQKETEEHKLAVEYRRPAGQDKNIHKLKHRRVVDIAHYTTECRRLEDHQCHDPNGSFEFREEIRHGLQSTIVFRCESCLEERRIDTTTGSSFEVNVGAVAGMYASGKGHYHLQEIMTYLYIPSLAYKTFRRAEELMGESWIACAEEEMLKAGQREREIAISKGQIDANGIPWIVVAADCSWSHRSYGFRFNAKNGTAVIIGKNTKQLLFIGVRNKYCSICAIATRQKRKVKHVCYKNWSGTSTGMEPDIIVQGFLDSEKTHGVRYKVLIADGDSSVFKQIIERVSFGREVHKIECLNHLMKGVSKRMHELAQSLPKKYSEKERKWFTVARIRQILKYTRQVLEKLSKDREDRETVKAGIKQISYHFMGDHRNCRRQHCKKSGIKEDLHLQLSFQWELMDKLDYLLNFATSVMECETTNVCEGFMHLITKFTGAKQVFYGKRNSYKWRAYGAALLFQFKQRWRSVMLEKLHSKPPPSIVKRTDEQRSRKVEAAARRRLDKQSAPVDETEDIDDGDLAEPLQDLTACSDGQEKEAAGKEITKASKDYGRYCQKPDLPDNLLAEKVEQRLGMLQSIDENARKDIERQTIGQADNPLWLSERNFRLTASHFGKVCKGRINPGNKVKEILYSKPSGPPIEWGKVHERTAIRALEQLRNIKVEQCGLFIDEERPYLGASPDGLVGDGAIVEVKCPFMIRSKTIAQGVLDKQSSSYFCLKKDKETGKIMLKRTHDYFYQIQGQMAISKRHKCYFVVWTDGSPNDVSQSVHIEDIDFDQELWNGMVPSLERFYINELLPELLDARQYRNLPIRNSKDDFLMRAANESAEEEEFVDDPSQKVEATARRRLDKQSAPVHETEDINDGDLAKPLQGSTECSDGQEKEAAGKEITKASKDYGRYCQKPDLPDNLLAEKVEQRLGMLQSIDENARKDIERQTIGQADNPLWLRERYSRLTASHFGKVCKGRRNPGNKVKEILYSKPSGPPIEWGKKHERTAIRTLEQLRNIKVEQCGLFIDEARPYLGASPDGLVGDGAIVEVKCPFVIRSKTIAQGVLDKQSSSYFCLKKDKETGEIMLKRTHDYFYQIQGQMAISKRHKCYFVVWTDGSPNDVSQSVHIEEIDFDKKLWNGMVPSLERFYINELLPELLDPRQDRNLPIRNSKDDFLMRAANESAEEEDFVDDPIEVERMEAQDAGFVDGFLCSPVMEEYDFELRPHEGAEITPEAKRRDMTLPDASSKAGMSKRQSGPYEGEDISRGVKRRVSEMGDMTLQDASKKARMSEQRSRPRGDEEITHRVKPTGNDTVDTTIPDASSKAKMSEQQSGPHKGEEISRGVKRRGSDTGDTTLPDALKKAKMSGQQSKPHEREEITHKLKHKVIDRRDTASSDVSEIVRMNQRQIQQKRAIRLQNGSLCPPVLIEGTWVQVTNSCGFDSLLTILATAIEDYDVYRELAREQRHNSLVNFAFMMTESVPTDALYIERAKVVLREKLGTVRGDDTYKIVDCFSNVSSVCCAFRSAPTATKTKVCTLANCGHVREEAIPYVEPNLDEVIGQENWCEHILEMLQNFSAMKKELTCFVCKLKQAFSTLEYWNHIFFVSDMIDSSLQTMYPNYETVFHVEKLATEITVQSKRYALVGVVAYIHSRTHYVAYVRRINGCWELHDDYEAEVKLKPSLNRVVPHLIVYVQL